MGTLYHSHSPTQIILTTLYPLYQFQCHSNPPTHTGIKLGQLPNADAIDAVKRLPKAPPIRVQDALSLLPTISQGNGSTNQPALVQTVPSAPGLPAVTKKLAEHILAGRYIDFSELPPAKGRCKLPAAEGQLVLIQAADLMQTKRLITDLSTWCQCFSIFSAIITTKYPERMPSLMAYLATIAKASARYKWPSWVVYDLNFRQEAADSGNTDWSKIDPGL